MITTILYSTASLEASCGNDLDFVRQIVEMCCDQMQDLSKQIQDTAETGNWPDVYFHAHKLKASIGLLEIASLKEDIKILTDNAKHVVNTDEILPQAKLITGVIEECIEQMKKDYFI